MVNVATASASTRHANSVGKEGDAASKPIPPLGNPFHHLGYQTPTRHPGASPLPLASFPIPMSDLTRFGVRFAPIVFVLAFAAGCHDRTSVATTDSAMARDLELAQRSAPGQMVFNDAPVNAPAPASPAPAAPTKNPSPAQARTPRPAPHRAAPPAPVRAMPTPSPTPAPVAAAPEPGPAAGVIGAGTRLGMTTNGRVCARTVLVGDKFTASVSSATLGSNGAMIPAGSTVVLEVASVDRADPIEASRIQFRVRAIDVDGVARPAEGEVATLGTMEKVQSSAGNERTKVVGGAVVGAVLGQIFGHSTKSTVIGAAAGAAAGTVAARSGQTTDACLPNGSALQLTLTHDLALRRVGAI